MASSIAEEETGKNYGSGERERSKEGEDVGAYTFLKGRALHRTAECLDILRSLIQYMVDTVAALRENEIKRQYTSII